MRFLSVSRSSFMIELADLDETLALFDCLINAKLAGIVEVIPAARTLLLNFNPSVSDEETLQQKIAGLKIRKGTSQSGKLVEIPVVYQGADLDEVAKILGIDRDEVIARHTKSDYRVAFCGFAPGFAYLSGGDPIFNVPRRASPRQSIVAGAVGLAGKFSGIYPRPSPGGWQLIGWTELEMFDLEREQPALLKPGDSVHFVDVTQDYQSDKASSSKTISFVKNNDTAKDRLENADNEQNVTIEKRQGNKKAAGENCKAAQTGLAAVKQDNEQVDRAAVFKICSTLLPISFQDSGRLFQSSQGISPSGALDQRAMKAANLVVGNAVDFPVLEITYGNARLLALQKAVIAFTGATLPITIKSATNEIITCDKNKPLAIDEGDEITLGAPLAGFRSYMALRGGFAVKSVLHSASFDSLSNLGARPMVSGEAVFAGKKGGLKPVVLGMEDDCLLPKAGETVVLDVVMGPRTDWFDEKSIAHFLENLWQVTAASNRIGIRLKNDRPLKRAFTGELPSEGTLTGAIEVPANGEPVLFLRDRPVTGGYPVIANLVEEQIDMAAQIPIGCFIKFRAVKEFFDSAARTKGESLKSR